MNYNTGFYFGTGSADPIGREILLCSGKLVAGIEVGETTSYPWFFEIPIYEAHDLRCFFNSFDSFDALAGQLTWHTFDHILYVFFRISTGRARLVNYAEVGVTVIPEFLSINDLDVIETAYGYRPLWMTAPVWVKRPADRGDLALMVYHVDRFPA